MNTLEQLVEKDLFETSDLPLVATLLFYGAKIASVERNKGPRATFFIQREKGLDGLIQGFYSRSLQVEPLAYFNALKEAKSRLYSAPIPYGD
jgi:hypothetical protein